MNALSGGDKLMAALGKIDRNLTSAGSGPVVRVGFLEGATYPDGTSVPMVAAKNEFGGTVQRAPGSVTVFRKQPGGRFVKRSQSNFATTHATPAYSITSPPRPFFRTMIAQKAPTWGADMAKLLKLSSFDASSTLAKMGDRIKGQLQQSIKDLVSPPLAPSTVRRKGFSKPLIDTGVMWQGVDYEVST